MPHIVDGGRKASVLEPARRTVVAPLAIHLINMVTEFAPSSYYKASVQSLPCLSPAMCNVYPRCKHPSNHDVNSLECV